LICKQIFADKVAKEDSLENLANEIHKSKHEKGFRQTF
jgi:hypothetical protein